MNRYHLAVIALVLAIGVLLFACPAHARPQSGGAPSVSISDVTVSESAGTATLTITKGRGKSYSIVTVTTVDGTAKAGLDYQAVNQSFTLGSTVTSKTFTVPIINDNVFEATEQFTVLLKSTRFANVVRPQATVTISDDDYPTGGGPGSSQPPPPTPTEPVVSPNGTHGEFDIADNFTTSTTLMPTIETVPVSSDPVGAFRFTCLSGQLLRDDPIVYPGQPGASHLHQFFGNTLANANSTYNSLRTTGNSTCTVNGLSVSPQRTLYWEPAMLDGAGNVVEPNYLLTYYKNFPAGNPECQGAPDATHVGHCIPIPNGLRFIFGYNMATGADSPTDPNSRMYYAIAFECITADQQTSLSGVQHSLAAVVLTGKCNVPGALLRVALTPPDCWDGVNLDTADHRSHMAYANGALIDNFGPACPSTHPYSIPQLAYQTFFTIDSNFLAGKWHFSSDEMVPGKPAGYTFHGDYWEAWSPVVKNMWQTGCIDGHLSCNVGEMGNGQSIIGMQQTHPTHVLVPLSSIP
jgi:hypothetical protein